MKSRYVRTLSLWIAALALAISCAPRASTQSSAVPTGTDRVRLSTKETKKLIVKNVRPEYPPLAQEARITGKCGVRVVINAKGELINVKLIYGHPIYAPACLDAARKWKSRPYVLSGQDVEVEGEVEMDWALSTARIWFE